MGETLFVLYVCDQAEATRFYEEVLAAAPVLDVPGMTQFALPGCLLGLMPNDGIRRILGERLPDPAAGAGIPRVEVYVIVDDPGAYHARALAAGATEISPLAPRDWGDDAAYSLDPDGHVLAFARRSGG